MMTNAERARGPWVGVAAGLVLALGLNACCPFSSRTTPAPAPKAVEATKPAEAPKPAAPAQPAAPAKPLTPTTVPPEQWLELFDGKTLKGWNAVKEDSFAMAGKVEVKDGAIILGEGVPFTGVAWTGGFPKEDFEVRWDGKRVSGIDIFGGLTVPVGDAHVTMVSGGWGDSVVGLSSIDDRNASDNECTKVMSFKNDQWYTFRLRVTKAKIEAWVDDKQVADLERGTHKFTIYDELQPNKPVGFFTWSTTGAVRNVEMKRLRPEG